MMMRGIMAIKVVINPANIGPDISLRVIFLNKHPSAEPNKIWTEITTIYIGIASTNWKICENADKIIGPIIVGPGIFNLTAKNHPSKETKMTTGVCSQL